VRRQALKDKKKLAREYAEQHFSSKNAEVFFNDY